MRATRKTHQPGDDDEFHVVDAPSPEQAPGLRSSFVIERRPALLRFAAWLDAQFGILFDIDHHPVQRGTDFTVRRVVDFPYTRALAALATACPDLHDRTQDTVGGAPHERRAVVHADATWLSLIAPERGTYPSGLRLAGALRVHRFGPPLPVEVVVEPWSGNRTELRMQLRTRRGKLRLPRHYFDAAHPVMGALRDTIETRAAA